MVRRKADIVCLQVALEFAKKVVCPKPNAPPMQITAFPVRTLPSED
jgi:hypothetical protein